MADYEIAASQVTFEGQLSRVRVDRVRMPDGEVAEREIVEHADAVAVVPVDDEGRVVLLRHYRHAWRRHMLEIPAGKCDVDGEAREETARRELAEEVGLEAGALTELVRFANSGGWTDEATTVYLATGLTEVTDPTFTATGEEADIEVLRLPLDDAIALTRREEVVDAKTIIGLLLARTVM